MNNDHQPTVQLVAISGSIRRASNCTAVLRSLQPLLPAGVTLHIAPLDAIPPYNADLDGDAPPEPVAALKRAIAAATASGTGRKRGRCATVSAMKSCSSIIVNVCGPPSS